MWRNKTKWFVWVVLALVLVTACKPSIPKGIIDPDDMEDFLYDYHLARAIAAQHQTNDSRDFNETMYHHAVLKKHGITQAELDSSFIYYYGHVERFAKIYQNVTKRLNEDAMELGASVGELGDFMTTSLSGDTANIWNETTSLLLLPHPGYNRVSFELKADSSFRKGDAFQYNMKANYLMPTTASLSIRSTARCQEWLPCVFPPTTNRRSRIFGLSSICHPRVRRARTTCSSWNRYSSFVSTSSLSLTMKQMRPRKSLTVPAVP